MNMERVVQYECKVCGRRIDVTRTGDVYEEPIFCCGVETLEIGVPGAAVAVPAGKPAARKAPKKPARKATKKKAAKKKPAKKKAVKKAVKKKVAKKKPAKKKTSKKKPAKKKR